MKVEGAVEEQIVCELLMLFVVISGLTVICMAVLVLEHPPEDTVLLYHVVWVNDPGEYPIALFVPVALANPATAEVVLLSHK